jgi:hypothetical protein
MLEREPVSKREELLEWVLPGLYDQDRLASMLLGLYNKAVHIRDFKVQIAEAVEAWHAGLHQAAVATMIPVLEGIIRRQRSAAHGFRSSDMTRGVIERRIALLEATKVCR